MDTKSAEGINKYQDRTFEPYSNEYLERSLNRAARFLPRDILAGIYFEYFFVSAVFNVTFWRFFLSSTSYPKIVFGPVYIPHVLTGGILMTIAIAILLLYSSKERKFLAAIFGGAGFGLFIDEFGKYVTRDANYFYQPAIAVIYIVFVLLFIGIRYFERHIKYTKEEYVVNSLDMIKEILINNLDSEERRTALSYLNKADPDNFVVIALKNMINESKYYKSQKRDFFIDVRNAYRKKYRQIIYNPLFLKAIILFFVSITFFNLVFAVLNFSDYNSYSELGVAVSTIISGSFVLIGIYALKFAGGRINTFKMFKLSVLVSIFLTQFFLFLEKQFTAVSGLFLNIIIYTVLQYLIYHEELSKKPAR